MNKEDAAHKMITEAIRILAGRVSDPEALNDILRERDITRCIATLAEARLILRGCA